jgi:hypothetical protein
MIELSINVPEVRECTKEIVEVPGRIFEIMRLYVQETVGRYLSLLVESELTFVLGREHYERAGETVNYRNGAYHRRFTLKGMARSPSGSPGTAMESLEARSYPGASDMRTRSGRIFA